MPSSGSVFSATLQSITTTKLNELSKKRASFDYQYAALQAAAELEKHPLKRLFLLIDGVKTCSSIKTAAVAPDSERLGRVISGSTNNRGLETDLEILDRLVEQARFDPSISNHILAGWEEKLWQHLDVQSLKHQYATLYGQLVTEWLSFDSHPTAASSYEKIDISEPFEEALHKKLESRADWENTVFKPADTDVAAINAYLNALFGKQSEEETQVPTALQNLKDEVTNFESNLSHPPQFTKDELEWTISGLLSSDLLNDEKKAVLKDFLGNQVILSEIADVLNMRMAALDSWSWGGDVPAEQRRTINGTYNIHLHEDVLQAIFIQFIGVKWSVFLRFALGGFRRHRDVWKSLQKPIPKADMKRRDYYLGFRRRGSTLQEERQSRYLQTYFMSQLPLNVRQKVEIEEGDEEVEAPMSFSKTKQTARKSTAGIAPRLGVGAAQVRQIITTSDSDCSDDAEDYNYMDYHDDKTPKRPMEAKQQLLHLLATEININLKIHGEFTCIRSAFSEWNSSLPHDTILTVLAYFGVSKHWLTFFHKFLEAPIRFIDDDLEARIRKRGTPGSHSLSEFFGEAVLFCLDFAINQQRDGLPLWRMHDEFFFWSASHSNCVHAWDIIETFEDVMGVSLDDSKSGAARIGQGTQKSVLRLDDSLPQGRIRWGFLYLDPTTGRFEIDQTMIDSHIEELRHQLQDKPKSIFSWIQTWNTFATTFITSNFGKPANCYGREHVDKILATHERIHRAIFPSHGSVVEHLKTCLKERFGAENIPDGFLFFPIELGGLNLQSPFIGPLQIRDQVLEKPTKLLDDFEQKEREEYNYKKQRFERDSDDLRVARDDPEWEPVDKDVFMSFEEFTRYREDVRYDFAGDLVDVFSELMEEPRQNDIPSSTQMTSAVNSLTHQNVGILKNWRAMEAYWKWVAQLYGPEMIDRFGGLSIVDPGLLPIGMISLFRNQRVNWSA